MTIELEHLRLVLRMQSVLGGYGLRISLACALKIWMDF